MGVTEVRKTWEDIKERPFRTLIFLLVSVLIALLVIWVSGYLGEKGRKAASQETDNRYVNVTPLAPSGERSWGMLVEFGVRHTPTDGFRVALTTEPRFKGYAGGFGSPWLKVPIMSEGTVFRNQRQRVEPPNYFLSFEDPDITPKRSYYLYFEADGPLQLRNYTFEEF